VAANVIRATALATVEHALSLLLESTAETATLYAVPAESPVSRKDIVWFAGGAGVGEATTEKADPGQGGFDVP
jgi:hypothetical protein